ELDRLCREGIQFSEALAVSPGSAASHAALLTSRYPVSSGVWANFSVMDGSVVTLAEILRESGYRTGGFVTNTFLGKRFHFEQGFDSYVESGVVEAVEEPSAATLWRSLAVVQIIDRLRPRFDLGYDPSFESALRWLEESDRPTFWFVHLMDVHSPYVPPPPYGERFGADPDGGPDTADRKRNKFGWRPSEEAYVAEIRFADHKIGRLRRALERRGWLDDAVILLTSDHGENLLDHEPNFSHGVTLFDSTLRILAALRAPGRVAPALRADPWENVDALPQIAEVLGWDPHPDWEGRPLAAPARTTPTYGQLNRDFAVRTPEWKVVLREDGTRDLYDLIRDPGETLPLTDADRMDEADAAFRAWLSRTATPLYLEQARSVKPDELSPETVEKLKSLGYLE
ncbi:MAG: sulfatase, partial [Gemmatimonadetes bacterium]|nr:sulfatase [Gemmatimonadota bacterium]